ncbi:MAG: GNAT family N-acetyltransferase [Pseudomonadota bacterium]
MTLRVGPTDDIALCQSLRRIVFIQGQNVPEAEEVDGKDPEAAHIIAYDGDTPIGTARVLPYGTTAKIGRVCVLAPHRGKGVGAALITACEGAARRMGATRAILGSQTHAIGFYEMLGYHAYGDVFDDAGIPHRMMETSLCL